MLREINSVARGGLAAILKALQMRGKKVQIRNFHFGTLTGAPEN